MIKIFGKCKLLSCCGLLLQADLDNHPENNFACIMTKFILLLKKVISVHERREECWFESGMLQADVMQASPNSPANALQS